MGNAPPRAGRRAHVRRAERVVFTGPGPGKAGHRFYANLGHFLARQFAVPPASSPDERQLYAALVQRIEQAGEISADACRRVINALRVYRPRNS